jgi:molecular chaperone GrpE
MAKKKQKTETTADNPETIEAEETTTETDVDIEEKKDGDEETPATTETGAESGADEAEVSPVVESDLEEQLELARQEAAKNLDSWQRAAAELANYKRRQAEQLKLQRDRIKGELLEGVLSALDDMELAFQNVPEELDGQLVGWVEGFRLVQRKLNKVLDDQNVMPINTDGEFDPTVHEAVSYEESKDHEEGQIIGEVRKGYQIGNRVLRPALVRVAK